ncbi:MAG: thiolase family protein [Rhodothermaceae bacterium]|nr:thiolase family protein [Rhodothermaceae bacterium]MXZ58827.1 thiolase family protein [Rhodothermaceae bacterium]MYB92167.1 thiolase family protein [Rhodothermaceae bacterium]MYD67329.1 thiolase family protein [Rhodothermaceae bacterium]MYG44712.1 thiolase family protein [Rhodothermaceae bacterium]
MRDVFVLSATRSPIGRFGGALSAQSPAILAAPVFRSVLDRAAVSDRLVDLILMGHVLGGGHGQLVARQAAKHASIPDSVNAVGVDMVCSSGMMSLMMGAAFIQSGTSNLILAGGVESMSQTGFALSSKARWGYKYLSEPKEGVIDLLHKDGLSDPLNGESMGVQAERLAQKVQISRWELDEVAAESHARAHSATLQGRFNAEITPISTKKGLLEQDEGIRPETTAETLSKLRPVFAQDGVLTAGNSSQISDGSAAILLASGEFVRSHGLQPIARILGHAWAAGGWERFVEAPIEASRRALSVAGIRVADIDLYENNEAFALSTPLFVGGLEIDPERLNVNGGAIALGHPIGCSGTRIVVTLIHALKAREKSLGLAALCHGTGGGTALALEML